MEGIVVKKLPAIAMVLAMASSNPVAAQGVVGHLYDFETGVVVVTASVLLTNAAGDTVGSAISAETGGFVILVEEPGRYSVYVSRLGYVDEVSAEIVLEADRLTTLEMTIHPDALALEGLVVSTQARVVSLRNMGFYMRKKSAIGAFLQPSEIEKTQAFSTSGLLRSVSALRIRNGVVSTLRGGTGMSGEPCRLKVFIDGRDAGIDLDDAVIRYYVAAIEVYKSAATVPGQYVSQVQQGYLMPSGVTVETCGAVLVWTQFGRN